MFWPVTTIKLNIGNIKTWWAIVELIDFLNGSKLLMPPVHYYIGDQIPKILGHGFLYEKYNAEFKKRQVLVTTNEYSTIYNNEL